MNVASKPWETDAMKEAVEAALDTINEPASSKILEPDASKNLETSAHTGLLGKGRVSFEKQLESLQSRLEALHNDIARSTKTRNQAIEVAESQHNERMKALQRDVYEVQTLRAAIELSIAVLGDRQ